MARILMVAMGVLGLSGIAANSGHAAEFVPIQLRCVKAQELQGDEVYLVAGRQKCWGPKQMDDGDKLEIRSNQRLVFADTLEVELYDEDEIGNPNDLLGNLEVTKAMVGRGNLTHEFRNNGGYYVLTYKVIP